MLEGNWHMVPTEIQICCCQDKYALPLEIPFPVHSLTSLLVDDAQKERVESDIKAAKGLGTIEIKFTRAIEYGPSYSRPYYDVKPRDFELAEKSLKGKAVSHGTSYGPTAPCPSRNTNMT